MDDFERLLNEGNEAYKKTTTTKPLSAMKTHSNS